jgi:GNAT superfamily N-acetyltransferase
MNFSLRPFAGTDSDYEKIARIFNASWPDLATDVKTLRAMDNRRDPNHFYHRLVLEKEAGEPVGYGTYYETWWNETPDQYKITYTTHPDYRNQGAGSLFYNHVMEALSPRGPSSYVTDTREDQPAAIHFLERRGFTVVQRLPQSELDLARFDRQRFVGVEGRMRELGITLLSLPKLQARDPGWKKQLYELEMAIEEDLPAPDPLARKPFEEWVKRFEDPSFVPAGWVIAMDEREGHYIGLSYVWVHKTRPETIETGLTGVRRPFRRKGIATALKLKIIDFAKGTGARAILTENDENNPMFGLNLQLGFEPLPAWLEYRKELEG